MTAYATTQIMPLKKNLDRYALDDERRVPLEKFRAKVVMMANQYPSSVYLNDRGFFERSTIPYITSQITSDRIKRVYPNDYPKFYVVAKWDGHYCTPVGAFMQDGSRPTKCYKPTSATMMSSLRFYGQNLNLEYTRVEIPDLFVLKTNY
ncbi:hypothetical protein K3495_g9520 [Podosphaera aphanis]|nr:hypothetical protein K3495_g9520 [Podosphaera aphanis]